MRTAGAPVFTARGLATPYGMGDARVRARVGFAFDFYNRMPSLAVHESSSARRLPCATA